MTRPHLIGQQSARIVLRILNGEKPSEIPIAVGEFVKPVFDWRQLQSFGISESMLPPGSEVRFREFSLWERYRWQMIAIFFALLLQAALIGWLLFEHHRRRIVEMKLRVRLLEVIHLNRTVTAGVLSASVAHELNQPLGGSRAMPRRQRSISRQTHPTSSGPNGSSPTYGATISARQTSSATCAVC